LRISNFFLYQLAYTELYFTDTLWPDFREHDLLKAIAAYQSRERRFGTVETAVNGLRAANQAYNRGPFASDRARDRDLRAADGVHHLYRTRYDLGPL
jgi:hypothetical protein